MIHFYRSGSAFLQENRTILEQYPLETSFFSSNAKQMTDMREGFIGKVQGEDSCLLAVRFRAFPMVLFGDAGLCASLADGLWREKKNFGSVLGEESLIPAFLKAYEAKAGGSHRPLHRMTVMCCPHRPGEIIHGVETAGAGDVDEIAEIKQMFHREALGEDTDLSMLRAEVAGTVSSYGVIRQNRRIASLACTCRESERLCAISSVYTRPEARGQGLARQTVTVLTQKILRNGKLPYLYVENSNPISNRLYRSIGYEYRTPMIQMAYRPEENGKM